MEIKHEDYTVKFDSEDKKITCEGTFRLTSSEYIAILELLYAAADIKLDVLHVDFTDLVFLNSSGINTLCKFIIRLRNNEAVQVKVTGSHKHAWQKKSLGNFKKILPSLEIEFS